MSQSSTSLRRTMRRRRRARRIGSPPVRRLRAQRPPHVDVLAVAALLVAARAPQRRRELEARHQPVELRELVRLERVEALAPEQLLVARRSRAAPRPRRVVVLVAAPGGDDDSARGDRCSRELAGRASVLGRAAGRPAGAADGPHVLGLEVARARGRVAEDREEDRVERRRPAPGRTRTRRGPSSTAAGA